MNEDYWYCMHIHCLHMQTTSFVVALASAVANSLYLFIFPYSFYSLIHTIFHHSVTQISTDLPSSGPSVSVNGNQQGNDDWVATAAYRLVADGHGLWQLSSAMTTLPGPSLGIISAQHISLSSASHTDLLIISICGAARNDSSDRLTANDSRRDGGWETENTACHFDSCNSSSSRVASRQSLDSWYLLS